MYRAFIDGEFLSLSSSLTKAKEKLRNRALEMAMEGCDRKLEARIEHNGRTVFETSFQAMLGNDNYDDDDETT